MCLCLHDGPARNRCVPLSLFFFSLSFFLFFLFLFFSFVVCLTLILVDETSTEPSHEATSSTDKTAAIREDVKARFQLQNEGLARFSQTDIKREEAEENFLVKHPTVYFNIPIVKFWTSTMFYFAFLLYQAYPFLLPFLFLFLSCILMNAVLIKKICVAEHVSGPHLYNRIYFLDMGVLFAYR